MCLLSCQSRKKVWKLCVVLGLLNGDFLIKRILWFDLSVVASYFFDPLWPYINMQYWLWREIRSNQVKLVKVVNAKILFRGIQFVSNRNRVFDWAFTLFDERRFGFLESSSHRVISSVGYSTTWYREMTVAVCSEVLCANLKLTYSVN